MTLVVVRERSGSDILDLGLQLSRIHVWPLAIMLCLGVIPLAVANHFLTVWMLAMVPDVPLSDESVPGLIRFVWTMILLVVIEAPLASVFVTSYLGKAVFLQAPRIRTVVREMLPYLPQVAVCHLLLRGVLPALLLLLTTGRDDQYTLSELCLVLLAAGVLVRRITAPFLNEILLLEKNPVRSSNPQVMTARKRIATLHGANQAGLVNQGLVGAVVALLVALLVFGTLLCGKGLFLDDWSLGWSTFVVGAPLAMWMAAGFLAVVRFLGYLDLRIRHEGWEVELRLRAEGNRLLEQMR
jgi:hypothetical protein